MDGLWVIADGKGAQRRELAVRNNSIPLTTYNISVEEEKGSIRGMLVAGGLAADIRCVAAVAIAGGLATYSWWWTVKDGYRGLIVWQWQT